MNKKLFFWIVVLLIPVLLVPPFALHVSKFGVIGIQHGFITDPPNFSEGISSSTLFVEILATLLIAFVLSKLKIKGEKAGRIFKSILILSVVTVIGLFAVSEIIKFQKSEIKKNSYDKGYLDGYKKSETKSKAVKYTDQALLRFGFSQKEINEHRVKALEIEIKLMLDAGFNEKEIRVEEPFQTLQKLKKSLNIEPIYVFPK